MAEEKIRDTQEHKTETDFEDDVLIISQTRNRVVLPYTAAELQKVLESGETDCKTACELIEKKYTVPLSHYKHACISRFREAFALVRDREKGSVLDALDLAFEMLFVRFLHPAIITACKRLDWLDVYLDCLDKNELDDFPFFRICYELNPEKTKRRTSKK